MPTAAPSRHLRVCGMREEDIAPIRPWLTETADLLRAGRDAAQTTFGQWKPAAGSHAEFEMSEAESVGWGDQMALVQVVLLDWTEAASGHLGALAAAVDAGEVTHSVPHLVRAVVEHAHKITWLLEPTPDALRTSRVPRAHPVGRWDRTPSIDLNRLSRPRGRRRRDRILEVVPRRRLLLRLGSAPTRAMGPSAQRLATRSGC